MLHAASIIKETQCSGMQQLHRAVIIAAFLAWNSAGCAVCACVCLPASSAVQAGRLKGSGHVTVQTRSLPHCYVSGSVQLLP